jgi:hypothetical protein
VLSGLKFLIEIFKKIRHFSVYYLIFTVYGTGRLIPEFFDVVQDGQLNGKNLSDSLLRSVLSDV